MGFILLLLLPIFGLIFYSFWRNMERAELVSMGKAAYFVKVAASGRGGVYHSMSCRKCVAWHELTAEDARTRGYAPCATCGGRGQFRLLLQPETLKESIDIRHTPAFHNSEKIRSDIDKSTFDDFGYEILSDCSESRISETEEIRDQMKDDKKYTQVIEVLEQVQKKGICKFCSAPLKLTALKCYCCGRAQDDIQISTESTVPIKLWKRVDSVKND